MFSESVITLNKDHLGKELGMQQALDNTPECSKEYVLDTIVELAEEKPTITADDLNARLERNGYKFTHRNALGGLFSLAQDMGWLKHSETFIRSKNPSRNGSILTVWTSLIFTPQQ